MEQDGGRWIKLDVCGEQNCPSRRYRSENGILWCQNGHAYSGNLTAANEEDDDDFAIGGRAYRKQTEGQERAKQHYTGRKAFEHYLLCYQLILRKQLWFLIKDQGLPAELEGVVVDLWSLRLSKLNERLPDGHDTDGESRLYSSQSEGTPSGTDTEMEPDTSMKRSGRKSNSTPSLVDALAMLYLGMQCLRLPYTLGDILGWVASGHLVYYRAIKQIPDKMINPLPGPYHESLQPHAILNPSNLQRAVLDLVVLYRRDHQVVFPPLNSQLLLFRLMRELALPLEVYTASQRLATMVGYSFDLSQSRSGRFRDISIPEVQLISSLVVVVKLLYPFDNIERHPGQPADPTVVTINWPTWVKRAEQFKSAEKGKDPTFEEFLKVEKSEAYTMGKKDIAKYLDWFQQTWTSDAPRDKGKGTDFWKSLVDIFPVEPPSTLIPQPFDEAEDNRIKSAQKARLKAVQNDMVIRTPVRKPEGQDVDDAVSRPGSHYRHWRKTEELPEHAKIFYEEAAKLIGISLDRLVKAVFVTERRLTKWRDDERLRSQG